MSENQAKSKYRASDIIYLTEAAILTCIVDRQFVDQVLDAVVPATHNHEPDPLDWSFDAFLDAARSSPRPCQVWPQVWPTGIGWSEDAATRHPPEAIIRRTRDIIARGADGVYYFNFCCYHGHGRLFQQEDTKIFRNLS